MAGYTRNDTAGNIADGNVISAAPLDGEFDAIQDAFALSTGHTHDGSTTGDGGPVSKLGPSQQLEQTTTALVPNANNSIDLGTSSAEFKDLHLDGVAYIDRLTVAASDGSADGVGSHLQPMTDASFDLGSTTYLWNNAYLVNLNIRKNDAPIITLTNTSTDILASDVIGSIVFDTLDTQQSGVSVARIKAVAVDTLDDGAGADDQVKLVFETGNDEALTTALTLQGNDTFLADDLALESDGAAIFFGADNDVSLAHVADTGLLLNSSREMQFRDSGLTIGSTADGQLDIDADTELEIAAPTVDIDASTAVTIDTATLTITGAANVSGDLDVDNININGNAITSTNTNGDITITPNGDGKIVLDGLNFPIADGSADQFIKTDGSGQLSFGGADVVDDTSPQLGGNLDTNSHNILIDDAHFIADENSNEQIIFATTASAVNEITVTNAAANGNPLIQASGDDTNIDLKLDGKGTGVVNVVDGLTVGGNLTVSGTTTTVNSTNTVIADGRIELANGTTGSPTKDTGIVIERGDSDNAFIGFDESEDKFKVGTGSFTGATTDADLTITTGTMVANLEGNVTGNITGNVTGTIQNGSSGDAYTFPASDGSSGQLLQTNGSGALSFVSAAASLSNSFVTSSGTVTKGSAGDLIVLLVGGGGGGQGGTGGSGGGEGAGGGASSILGILPNVPAGQQLTVTIGSGGSGASGVAGNVSNPNGSTGGTTTVSYGSNSISAAGGNGNLNAGNGSDAGNGLAFGNGDVLTSAGTSPANGSGGGRGSDSILGKGGTGGAARSTNGSGHAGSNATGYGAGGGGGSRGLPDSATGGNGGNGSDGCVVFFGL